MFKDFDLVVVGSGLFGAVTAEQASRDGYKVAVIESRGHIGGNCYTENDPATGINVHKYGAHIFHTSNERVWNYINQFTKFNNYHHKVRSMVNGRSYSMPINLDTINSYFDENFTPEEAERFIKLQQVAYTDPANFEEQAMALIGPVLYKAFIKGYTEKQWETDPRDLPASIIKRLPVRYNYDDSYYFDTWSGIPVDGYTPIFERMLNHENIRVFLNTDWFDIAQHAQDKLVVYTGPIDRYYDYRYGMLQWRTLDFDFKVLNAGDYQGVAAMNYADADVPYTRIIEHKHFHPEKKYPKDKTVIHFEYSREATEQDTKYYPINTEDDRNQFNQYRDLTEQEINVIFGGRLGEYMYYDMHQVIGSALSAYEKKVKIKLTKQ
ncbi:Glf UDP-galactopyranose mutase [uncultured Caudovirales phage]|uniref:Glf UDP-galactopyranose mutase n=1 Tax=uncultured Caudovirales phage TaxID=2100421 RepID=A0A6J7WP38_9CAUD|nr:Glf UDP-galactopyranose mutase [uncultured Caudovirales phage]